jgi:hypothetical protein
MPSTFEAEDLRRVDREMQASLQAYVAALTDLNREVPTLAPGQATPTPIPIRTLGPATGFDIVAASDPASQAEVILVAGPIPSWLDLPTLMTTAHSGLPGEVEVGGQEIVGGAPRETGRLYITLYDRSRGTVDPRLYYFTIEGGRMWTLIFRAPDLDPLLPVFETAALSLTPAP